VNVAHSHDLSFSFYCGTDVVVTWYGIMVGGSNAREKEALDLYFCMLKVVPMLKSFHVPYGLLRGI